MYVDKVKYTAQYDEYGVVKHMWIGVDVAVADSDDPEKAFQLAKEMTEHFHKQANHHLEGTTITDAPGPPQEIQVEKNDKVHQIEVLVKDIMNETVLRGPDGRGGLLAWKMLVERDAVTNPESKLKAAFDLRKSQLELDQNLKDMEGKWPYQQTEKK